MGTFAFSWHVMEMRVQRPAATCAVARRDQREGGRELSGTDRLYHCHVVGCCVADRLTMNHFTKLRVMACFRQSRPFDIVLSLRDYSLYLH